jgi:methionyl-tRNA synthetase
MAKTKTIFIRCSEQTKRLLQEIKNSENRSENSQVIHMIHREAKRLDISIDREPTWGFDANGSPTTEVATARDSQEIDEKTSGLTGLAEKFQVESQQ